MRRLLNADREGPMLGHLEPRKCRALMRPSGLAKKVACNARSTTDSSRHMVGVPGCRPDKAQILWSWQLLWGWQ